MFLSDDKKSLIQVQENIFSYTNSEIDKAFSQIRKNYCNIWIQASKFNCSVMKVNGVGHIL